MFHNNRKKQKSTIFDLSSRKGQGLSMNVIIIAAIALLVLVILSVLVLRSGNEITQGKSCLALQGATCEDSADGCPSGYFMQRDRNGEGGGCYEDEICCVPL